MLREDPDIEATEHPSTVPGRDAVGRTVDIIHVGLEGMSDSEEAILNSSAAAVLVVEGLPSTLPPASETPVALIPADSEGEALIAATRATASGLSVVDTRLAQAARIGWRIPSAPILSGDTHLTPREQQVIELVARGLPNKAIAAELGISEHTVKFHMGSLMGKLGAESRTEAVTTATRRGILTI